MFDDVEDEFRVFGDKVAKDRFSVAYYMRMNKNIIGDIFEEEAIRKDAENYSELTVSRIYLISTPPTREKQPTVVVIIGEQEYRIQAREFEIGRNPQGANIQIRYGDQIIDTPILDMTVSRKHLRVSIEGKKVYMTDLGSTNGTWIDSRKAEPNEKIMTNEVKIGGQRLRIKIKVK